MSAGSIGNTDRINYLNIGLMLVSCALAFVIPFQLFLFAYAVMGPAHYLTEISWLHERKYFTKGKFDFLLLGGLAILLFLLVYVALTTVAKSGQESVINAMTGVVILAFGAALVFVFAQTLLHRVLGLLLVAFVALFSSDLRIFFLVFLPTIIHVYLFTGFFIIYGALKGRSKSGYLSFLVFLAVPFLFLLIMPADSNLTDATRETYGMFTSLNMELLKLGGSDMSDAYNSIFSSQAGLVVMRFIAFAYTYHYLNWFSKTSVIRWHDVSKKRLAGIALLWLVSVGLYAYNYKLGFDWLFLLSYLHVFLEFPLNHTSIVGTFRELKAVWGGVPAGSQGKNTGRKK